MNKTDMAREMAARTGWGIDACEKALKAFEDICGDVLTRRFKGIKHDHAYVVTEMAERTGQNEHECAQLMKAFEDVLDDALGRKLGLLRKSRP